MSIPLTFDWLTLAWLKTRLNLWWRGRRRFSLRQLALVLMLGVFSGCVPVTRFEETQSAAQVEMEGRRRAEYQVAALKAENLQLRAQMQQEARAGDEREEALSQAELDSSTQVKQREDAEGMVEQLRGELARVGNHLQAFNDDKQQLQASLQTESARGRSLARLSRDVALTFAEPVATGEYSLDAEQGRVVLRVPREKLLAEDGSVKPEAEAFLKAVSRVLKLHQETKLAVRDSSAPDDAIVVSQLVAALGAQAIAPERFQTLDSDAATSAVAAPSPVTGVAPAPSVAIAAPSGTREIALGFSVP